MKVIDKSESIESLQALRAFAAIFVLLFHAQIFIPYYLGPNYILSLFCFGYSGVDIFFVLSGFIIYYTSFVNKSLTPREFLIKRFIRIFPIYWISLIANISLLLVLKYFIHYRAENEITIGSFNTILKSIFLIPEIHRIVGVSWTLSFEVAFYLLFGLLFFQNRRLFAWTLTIWIVICYIHLIYLLSANAYISSDLFTISYLNPIVLEFLFGCIVAMLITKGIKTFATLSFFLGIIIYIISAILSVVGVLEENSYRIIAFGFPAALIIYALALIKANVSLILTFLGDASYSIYLFHVPIGQILTKLTTFLHINAYVNLYIILLFIIFFTTLLCCAIFYYIENPTIKYIKKILYNTKECRHSVAYNTHCAR